MKNSWQQKNVFVTGGAGFLGSWLVKALIEQGARVVVLVRDSVPQSALFSDGLGSKVILVHGSLIDYFVLERILGEYEIDTVFHLAAQAIAPVANKNPLSTFETNIQGTWNLLEAARRSPLVKKIIVASSDKAYGDSRELPYTEDIPLRGVHPYDVSKTCADLIAQAYFISYGLPVCITRCGNLFGGGDLNFSRLIPGVIRSILLNEPPVLRSNGEYIRDFLYVEDAVSALLTLAEAMDKKDVLGNAFNFGNGNQWTVLQIARLILERMGSKAELVILNESPNEILSQYLSSKKAEAILGWHSRHNIEEALDRTIAWYRDFFKKQTQAQSGQAN